MNVEQILQALAQGEQVPHSTLYRARDVATPEQQRLLGPAEHGAFAREWTQENPLAAIPLAVAIPGYSAAKALGLIKSRTPASLDEVKAGYQGVLQGLLGR